MSLWAKGTFMSAFIRPIKFAPVFVGKTEDGTKIVVYNVIGREQDLHIKVGDEEIRALSLGSAVESSFSATDSTLFIAIRSPEWTGTAKGTRRDLLDEEAIR